MVSGFNHISIRNFKSVENEGDSTVLILNDDDAAKIENFSVNNNKPIFIDLYKVDAGGGAYADLSGILSRITVHSSNDAYFATVMGTFSLILAKSGGLWTLTIMSL